MGQDRQLALFIITLSCTPSSIMWHHLKVLHKQQIVYMLATSITHPMLIHLEDLNELRLFLISRCEDDHTHHPLSSPQVVSNDYSPMLLIFLQNGFLEMMSSAILMMIFYYANVPSSSDLANKKGK